MGMPHLDLPAGLRVEVDQVDKVARGRDEAGDDQSHESRGDTTER